MKATRHVRARRPALPQPIVSYRERDMDASAASAAPAAPHFRIVLVYSKGRKAAGGGHELDTQWELARQIAELKGAQLAGYFDDACNASADRYVIPDDTLTVDEARKLGVASERDLYGGV